jgi:hypothetical protein
MTIKKSIFDLETEIWRYCNERNFWNLSEEEKERIIRKDVKNGNPTAIYMLKNLRKKKEKVKFT